MQKSFRVFFLKRIISGFLLGLIMMTLSIGQVAAAPTDWDRNELGLQCVAGPHNDVATIQGVGCMIANVSSVVFTILGFGGLIMLTFSGVQYMLSGGSSTGVEKVKKSITGIVVGLLLALGSFLIVKLISDFTGVNITTLRFFSSGAPEL